MEVSIPYELRKIYNDEGIDLIPYVPDNYIGDLRDSFNPNNWYNYYDKFIYDMF